MEGKRRPWSIRFLPLSFWSAYHESWCALELPMRIEPGEDLWVDFGSVIYGMAEFHFSCEEICHVHMSASETLNSLQKNQATRHTYYGLGQYPVMLGQQVLRFLRLEVEKPCTLSAIFTWSRRDPDFPPCPLRDESLVHLWQNACSVLSFCWQEGLWHQPSLHPKPYIYGLWVHGPALFCVSNFYEDWRSSLSYILENFQPQTWLDDSPLASFWVFLAVAQYYEHTHDEQFLQDQNSFLQEQISYILQFCSANGHLKCPSEPERSLWFLIFSGDKEEIVLAQQSTFFWMLSQVKHLAFHLNWVELFAKIEHLLALREEFWLFPHTPVGAALAVLGGLSDRRQFFSPQMQRYSMSSTSLEMILLILALRQKGETVLARKILEQFWVDKTTKNSLPEGSSPEQIVSPNYIVTSWDAAPLWLITMLKKGAT